MNKILNRIKYISLLLLMVMSLISCSGSGSGDGGTGTLGVGLTDAPGDYLHVFVTIDEVQVKKQGANEGESGWITALVPSPQKTFDLLELQNGVIADLGIAELEAGKYNQMRLILGTEPDDPEVHNYANYLVIEGEAGQPPREVELKVPSGLQTGIKIVHGFTIVADGATEITLDFDANKSIVEAGESENWLLKPTIKVLETLNNSVSGIVDPPGARVSAQLYDANAVPLDQVTIEGATTSDGNGDFLIYLPPNTYNIVATLPGYFPDCQVVAATPGYQNYTAEAIVLTEAETTGTFTGTVAGVESADFSIRQPIYCGSADVMIEVASVSVAGGETSLPIILPPGIYEVVVSSTEAETETYVEDIEIVTGENIDVVYPPPL
jgi:hypothetical protein